MSRILIIAPHPDDETLGAGGTLLKHRQAGHKVHWLIVTAMRVQDGFCEDRIAVRELEIQRVSDFYNFASRHELALPAARLETLPLGDIIQAVTDVIHQVLPEIVYLPFPGDAHSDHKVSFDAASAALKWFRAPSIKRIYAYETLSETGFRLDPLVQEFRPNWFVDISAHLQQKIAAMRLFGGEIGQFPFPRSPEAIVALAQLRGSLCGCSAAEAFLLLKGID